MSEQVLKLKGVLLDHLPENYSFDGTLDLEGSSIKELPKGLFVSGDLILGDQITVIPPETIIGGNVYWTQTFVFEGDKTYATALSYEPSSIVAGKIYISNGEETISFVKPSNKENYLLLDDGEIFWYKYNYHYTHRVLRNHDFDRTPFDIYYGYNEKNMAVRWSTPRGTFAKRCSSRTEAKFLVNYQDAIERGLEQYVDIDIDTLMLGQHILDMYQVCGNACMPGIDKCLQYCGIDLNKQYTVRYIGTTLQSYCIETSKNIPALDVFLHFFKIPIIKGDSHGTV